MPEPDGPPPLRELQRWMQTMLMGAAGGRAPTPDATGAPTESTSTPPVVGAEDTGRTADLVVATAGLSSRQHLAIYQRSYLGRLREVMSRQFPTLEHALGAELFRAFADDYLRAFPPQSYTLNDLGGRFAQFLEQTRPDRDAAERESWPDFMIELASFEFAVNLIFDQRADERFAPALVSDADDEIELIPVLHLFRHRFPISRYYRVVSNGGSPDLPFPAPELCVVVRREYRMDIVEVTERQFHFLRALRGGVGPSRAAELSAAARDGEPGAPEGSWSAWRAEWIEAGLFRRRADAAEGPS